jgi:hypothetical protein
VVIDSLASALRGEPYWGYVHGGRAFHARRRRDDRRSVCGVEPKGRGTWRRSYQLRIISLRDIGLGLRPECSRCHTLLRAARIGPK